MQGGRARGRASQRFFSCVPSSHQSYTIPAHLTCQQHHGILKRSVLRRSGKDFVLKLDALSTRVASDYEKAVKNRFGTPQQGLSRCISGTERGGKSCSTTTFA